MRVGRGESKERNRQLTSGLFIVFNVAPRVTYFQVALGRQRSIAYEAIRTAYFKAQGNESLAAALCPDR